MKKFLAILLSALFVLTVFTSCGGDNKPAALTAEDVLTKSIEASENIDNFAVDASMEMSLSAMGESMDMTMTMDCERDDEIIYINMETSVSDEATSVVETYIDMASDPAVQYAGTGELWIKQPVEEVVLQQYKEGNIDMDLSMYSEYMKDATIKEVEFNGVACYELSGVIDIDYTEMLKTMNMESIVGDIEALGLPENFFEELFKDTEPFVLVLGVNKETFLPEYASMDMTQLMESLLNKMMKTIYEQYGMAEIEGSMEFDVSKCIMKCTYRDYNNVSLEIPAEIIENAVEVGIEY